MFQTTRFSVCVYNAPIPQYTYVWKLVKHDGIAHTTISLFKVIRGIL